MSSLFKNIWNRNFRKGNESIDKFAEDVGGLKGIVSWTKLINGSPVETKTFSNDVTQLSKSTVVRLLAQGNSTYRGTIDPTAYKLSRMRFGNAPSTIWNSSDNKILAYYDPLEKSFRDNATNYLAGPNRYAAAGGRTPGTTTGTNGAILAESGSSVNRNFTVGTPSAQFPSPSVWAQGADIAFNIDSAFFSDVIGGRPPSHKSLSIDILNASNQVMATIRWNSVYSRKPTGNAPTELVTGTVPAGNIFATDISDETSPHRLLWNATSSRWRVSFKLANNVAISDARSFNVKFTIGEFNVINSIVPRTGFNGGTSGGNRFTSLDYYSINPASVSYADSPTNFIDDYAATFSVTMNTTEGNGAAGSTPGTPVLYTEAFLFNDRDDLFSIVRFAPPDPYATDLGISPGAGFVKDINVAFLISWQIKALV